jgi:2-polyprenyl-3-methyl-5-hydroxy-6-metoxy-1,4-benzoquinol methylase
MENTKNNDKDYCPLCQNFFSKKEEANFKLCEECGLFVKININFEEIDLQYKIGWKFPQTNIQQSGATDNQLSISYVKQLQKSLNLRSFEGQKILDYGAGRGLFAITLRSSGAEVVCVEPYGSQSLQDQGFTVFKSLEEIPENMIFDGIVCQDVLEHLFDPWSDLRKLNTKLVPRGWFYLATPNSKSLNSIITGERWREKQNPGHIFLFNSKNLIKSLKISGFQQNHRLKWNIIYNSNWLSRIKNWLLLQLRLDGELRYLSFRDYQ